MVRSSWTRWKDSYLALCKQRDFMEN